MPEGIAFADLFDFYRVVAGTVTAELIFVEHTAVKRDRFAGRLLLGCLLLCLMVFPHIQLLRLQNLAGQNPPLITAPAIIAATALWWLLVSIATVGLMAFCYESRPCSLLFQCLFGLALEQMATVVLQYVICKKLFPTLQENHRGVYMLLTLLVYTGLELLAYLILIRQLPEDGRSVISEDKKTFAVLCAIFLFLSVMADATSILFEMADTRENGFASQEFINHYAVPYYCVAVNLIICSVIMMLQALICRLTLLREEKKLLLVLQKEKEQQYRFSRESMDLINQKCHDLKRQINALKLVHGQEKERLFAETEKAVQFYDARIHTGSSVVDTLLTEKSFYCAGNNIRFGCSIHPVNLDFLDMIDLYTMLGNALDNAIECVSSYEEAEKRIVNVTILERGSMLHLFVDNYFEGNLEMKGGFPVTHKKDRDYHGYGVKSMQMLAKKYKGDLRISVQNHTFSLQIMIPSG